MAHKSDTPADSEDMPKIPKTVIRDGIFYARFVYPKELVKAGLVSSRQTRKSLGTRDWRKAKRMMVDEEALFEAEKDRLKSKLRSPNRPAVQQGKLKLSSFTRGQRRELVLSWFVESLRENRQFVAELEEEDDSERIEEVRIMEMAELGYYYRHEEANFFPDLLRKKLKENGIEYSEADISDEFVDLFKRSVTEAKERLLRDLGVKGPSRQDAVFKEYDEWSEAPSPGPSRTVQELCTEFISAKESAGRSPSTLKKHLTSITLLKELIGPGTPLAEFDLDNGDRGYEMAKEVTDFLRLVVVGSKTKFPQLTYRQASNREQKKKNPCFIDPKTQHDHLINFNAVFRFALQRKWIRENPFANMQDRLPQVISRPKDPPTGEELTRLLSSPEFQKERIPKPNGERREGRFWCVILCLFHGMRLNEAASLLVSDIREEDGILFMDFREFDDNGRVVKRLKNTHSRRRVPVHQHVLRIGFGEFVEYRNQTAKPGDWLFCDLKADTLENRGGYVSKWFTRVRNKILGKPERKGDKSIHSFRHKVSDAIRAVTESDEILNQIGGWARSNPNSSARYGKGDLKRLKKVVDKIQFDGFDPSFLFPENHD